MITNSNLRPRKTAPNVNQALVLPQGMLIPLIPNTPEDHDLFVKQFLMSKSERQSHDDKAKHARETYLSEESMAEDLKGAESGSTGELAAQLKWQSRAVRRQRFDYIKADKPLVLICGHNSRDSRCGIMGPLLENEFRRYTIWQQVDSTDEESSQDSTISLSRPNIQKSRFDSKDPYRQICVGLTSHVGGHAWAGNVIVYIPWNYRLRSGETSPLGGKSIWYGRVEPKHVEGIVEETILRGRIIEELLRGVHGETLKIRRKKPEAALPKPETPAEGLLHQEQSERQRKSASKKETGRSFRSNIYG